jgi:uncharacterized protein (TIGR03437 family)
MRFFWAILCALPLTAADVAVAPQSLLFTYQYNSTVLVQQTLVIASPAAVPFTASRPLGDAWLLLPGANPATISATGPLLLPVAVDPGKLTPGTYRSAITLRFADGSIPVPVTFQVTAGTVLAVSPAVLFFDPSSGAQSVVAGLTSSQLLPITASTTTPWLTVSAASNPWQVILNGGKAPPGMAVGTVDVRSSPLAFVSNSPVQVPAVYLPKSLGSTGPLTAAPATVRFSGSGSQPVVVTGGAFTASSDQKWLTTTVSGSTLTLAADPSGLAAGSYTATVTVASAGVLQMIPATLTVGTAAAPVLSKLVNAASYAPGGGSPGEIVVLGGTGIGPANLATLALEADGSVSKALAGVQVTFNGAAAPIVYASATQVAVAVPYEVDGAAAADVVVTVNGLASNTLSVPVAVTAPGVFTADASGLGPGAILNSDNSLNAPGRPAAKGDIVAVYMTGEGQTNPGGVTGRVTSTPPIPRQAVTATVDGQPAEIRFAGEAPGILSGVMQVNIVVPAAARTGEVPLVVTVGGIPSQSGVTLSVR